MKKILFLIVTVLLSANTCLRAQTIIQHNPKVLTEKEVKKAAKDAKKAAKKAKKKGQSNNRFKAAAEALKTDSFVLEVKRVEYKSGFHTYVTPTVNFISLKGNEAVIQLYGRDFPELAVKGKASGIEMNTDKKGNIEFKMQVQGVAISAVVTIFLTKGDNMATATIDPSLTSNRVSVSGILYPSSESKVFQGRTL